MDTGPVSYFPLWDTQVHPGASIQCKRTISVCLHHFYPDDVHPIVYIGSKTFNGEGNLAYLIIYLVIVMTFSPIGEELFYRGVVHKAFSDKLDKKEKWVYPGGCANSRRI